MISPLEYVADAIMSFEGWAAGTRSQRNRNPGNLREGANMVGTDGENYAVYESLIDGYDDLLHDLECKFTGENHHGLGPESTVAELMAVYAPESDNNQPLKYAFFLSKYVSRCMVRTISPATKLKEIYPVVASPDTAQVTKAGE